MSSLNFILSFSHFFPKYIEYIRGGETDLTFIKALESLSYEHRFKWLGLWLSLKMMKLLKLMIKAYKPMKTKTRINQYSDYFFWYKTEDAGFSLGNKNI